MKQDPEASLSNNPLVSDQVFWLVSYLDMYISNLLGVHPLLDCSTSTSTSTPAINTAIQNVTLLKRSDGAFLSEVSLAMVVELESLIQRTGFEKFDATPDKDVKFSDSSAASTDAHESSSLAQIDFATWEQVFQNMFPSDDNNPRIAL